MTMRWAGAAVLTSALCGCVAFEAIPVAELGCDPALAGRWVPHGMPAGDAILIDEQCRALIPAAGRSAADAEPVRLQLRSFEQDAQRYLVFDKADLERVAGLGANALAGSDLQSLDDEKFLLRYRIDGDNLQAAMNDQTYARDAIDGGSLPGKALAASLSLIQADAAAMPALLREHPELFVAEGRGFAAFERAGAERAR